MDATPTEIPTAGPIDEDEFRAAELADEVADRVIVRYREAQGHLAEAERLARRWPVLERWAEVLAGVANDAESQVVAAILATHHRPEEDRSPRPVALGVRSFGRTYLAVLDDPDDATGRAGYRLAVAEEGAIVAVDGDRPDAVAELRRRSEALAATRPPEPPPLDPDRARTEVERLLLRLARHVGEDEAYKRFRLADEPLTADDCHFLGIARGLGRQEASARLTLSGAYGVIHEAVRRLGDDAVAELHRRAGTVAE